MIRSYFELATWDPGHLPPCFGFDQEVPKPFPNVDRKTGSARCRSERARHLRCEDFASEVHALQLDSKNSLK